MKNIFKDKNGKPIFVLGLQAHNSSSLCDEMLDRAILAVKQYGGNTLEAPVYWFAIEPEEGKFDTSMVEHLIYKVREAGLHLVILWFGFSKNTDMTYMPDWAKLDTKRFPLTVGFDGAVVPMMSPHYPAVAEADARAFAEVMKCIRRVDEAERTVIAVQVENEIGMYPTDRCYSVQAEADFAKGVPAELDGMKLGDFEPTGKSNGWYDRFGYYADEAFTCWYLGRQLERVASVGKTVYPDMPLYTNAALGFPIYESFEKESEDVSGFYHATGEPVPRMVDIYRKAAPSIDLYAPDIYRAARSEYFSMAKGYIREDNPLFIPETGTGGTCFALNHIHAAADFGAIGICGFGAETTLDGEDKLNPENEKVAQTMRIIASMAPVLEANRGTGRLFGVTQEEGQMRSFFRRENYFIEFSFDVTYKGRPIGKNTRFGKEVSKHPEKYVNERGRAIVYEASPNEYYMAGMCTYARFTRRAPYDEARPMAFYKTRAAIEVAALSIEEGHFDEDGKWVCEFRRTGDEIDCGAFLYPGIVLRVVLNPNAPFRVEGV